MRQYSFSSNKSQLLVSRMSARSQALCRVGRRGWGLQGMQREGSQLDVRKNSREREGAGVKGRGDVKVMELPTQVMFVRHGGGRQGNSRTPARLGFCSPRPMTSLISTQATWHPPLHSSPQGMSPGPVSASLAPFQGHL